MSERNNDTYTKNWGKKIGTIGSWQSKWGHWNVRLFCLAWIITELWIAFCKANPLALTFIPVFFILLWKLGKKLDWAHLKTIVYEYGVLNPLSSKCTYNSKPLFEGYGAYKVRKKMEFVYFNDVTRLESVAQLGRSGKYIVTSTGYKYFVPRYSGKDSFDKLLSYIKEKIEERTDENEKRIESRGDPFRKNPQPNRKLQEQ